MSHTSSSSNNQYIGPAHLKAITFYSYYYNKKFFAATNTVRVNNIMAGQYQHMYKYWGDAFIPCLTYLENKIPVLTSGAMCMVTGFNRNIHCIVLLQIQNYMDCSTCILANYQEPEQKIVLKGQGKTEWTSSHHLPLKLM